MSGSLGRLQGDRILRGVRSERKDRVQNRTQKELHKVGLKQKKLDQGY